MIVLSVLLADTRSFVWTYEYATMPAGVAEIEHYMTLEINDSEMLENNVTTKHDIEVEIGMNDRFDIGIYQSFKQSPNMPFEYTGFKIRGRYRIGEENQWIMDPLLYFEYKSTPDFHHQTIESKIILAKKLGRVQLALNPVYELEFEDRESESEFGYSAGIAWEFSQLFKLGSEFKGNSEKLYWGPTISHGKDGMYIAVGYLNSMSGSTNSGPEAMVRVLMGIEL